ncbi:MAG: hypothetical protein M3Z09_02945 [Acidobacteriota bacterium]|nr:hypothetical protein [Acidobacteriota bacterium]
MKLRLAWAAASAAVIASVIACAQNLPAPDVPAPAKSSVPSSADLILEDPSVLRARLEVDKIRMMVENGTLPRIKLEKAEQDLLDKRDEALITRALYGKDITSEQAAETVAAAQRRLDRRKKVAEEERKLLSGGVIAKQEMVTTQSDVDRAQKDLEWAVARGKLVKEVENMASAEAALMMRLDSMSPVESRKLVEHYDGKGSFTAMDRYRVEMAFRVRFAHPIPISADGGSAVHRSMGFDHRGRVDVAVNPDAPEGVWLRHFLTVNRIPFFAFRAAVAHKATGAHVHMGPASTRYVPGISGAGL